MKIPRSWCYNFVAHWWRGEKPNEEVEAVVVRRKVDGAELFFCVECWDMIANTPFIKEYEIVREPESR